MRKNIKTIVDKYLDTEVHPLLNCVDVEQNIYPLDIARYRAEFEELYSADLARAEPKLIKDINKNFSERFIPLYRDRLPIIKLSNIIEDIISEPFLEMRGEAEELYVKLRSQDISEEDAFLRATTPVLNLIQSVTAGTIRNTEIYDKIKTYLDRKVAEETKQLTLRPQMLQEP